MLTSAGTAGRLRELVGPTVRLAAIVVFAMTLRVAGQQSTNVSTIVGLGLPPADCLYWCATGVSLG
jgi:hypothetical protein